MKDESAQVRHAHNRVAAAHSLPVDTFYRPVHGALFAAMRHLAAAHHPALGERPTKEDEFAWVRDTVAGAAQEASSPHPSPCGPAPPRS